MTCTQCDERRAKFGDAAEVGKPCDICDGTEVDALGRPCRHCSAKARFVAVVRKAMAR